MTTMGGSGRLLAWVTFSSTCAVGAGCSIINAYPDVAPQSIADAGPTGSDSGTALAEGGADATTGATDGALNDAGSGAADGASETGASGPHGAIVVGGTISEDGGEEFVLTALDPATGSELAKARVPMIVSAVRYDGLRDLWYVFESGGQGIFPLPTDPFYLHTRTLDPTTGDWTELGKFPIPAGVSFATTTVVSQRVSYVAYGDGDAGAEDGGAPFSLVTLDTTMPAAVTVASTLPLAQGYGAIAGTRSQVNPAGGFVTLGTTTKIGANTFVQLTPVLLPSADPPAIESPIVGTFAASSLFGLGTATINGTMDALVVTRSSAAGSPATLAIYDPSASDPTMALLGAGTFPFNDSNINAPAFSVCDQTAFVVGTNADTSVHAVQIAATAAPVDGGVPALASTAAATGHSGQGVYFEPFTSTVLTPFSQGNNFALTAFTLGGTPGAPQLVQRQDPFWVPPPNLRPNFIATRDPFPGTCPAQGDR
jgi:hypothetical protein